MRNQHRTHSLLGAALLGSVLTVGCAADAGGEDAVEVELSEQALEQQYDGETLVLGVFFGRGPVAPLLPEIWGKAPQSKAEAAEAFRQIGELERHEQLREYDEQIGKLILEQDPSRDQVADEIARTAVARLVEQDPGLVEHFGKSWYSGDPVLVSDAVKKVAERFAELVEIEVIRDPGRYGSDWVVNQNVVINENAAVNVNVAVNVDTAYNVTQFWSRVLDRESMLRNEVMVAKFAARFDARGLDVRGVANRGLRIGR